MLNFTANSKKNEENTQPDKDSANGSQPTEFTVPVEQPVDETPETTPIVSPYTEAETKPAPVEKKPRSHKINFFIVVSLALILLAGAVGYMFLNSEDFPFLAQLLQRTTQQSENPEETPEQPPEEIQNPEPTEPPIDPEQLVEYTSRGFEFAFKHKAKARVVEPGSFNTQLETYQIIYEGPGQTEEATGPENLRDGYIVTITVHKDVLNQAIDQIALEKRNRYLISCDDSATISGITDRTIANRTAKTFSVENCGVNYIQSFFLRGNDLFEFNQIYRGDIGVRQVYKAETDEIINNFRIINVIEPTPKEAWSVYDARNFTFKHPAQLDPLCCTVRGPINNTAKKEVVMADPRSLEGTDGTLFNGFGVYVDSLRNTTFDDYVEAQRRLLIENYEIVVGKKPFPEEENLTIDGKRAIMLKGYAWWGDMVFVEVPTPQVSSGNEIAIFVKTELDPGTFDSIFREILTTIDLKNQN